MPQMPALHRLIDEYIDEKNFVNAVALGTAVRALPPHEAIPPEPLHVALQALPFHPETTPVQIMHLATAGDPHAQLILSKADAEDAIALAWLGR